MWHRRISLHIEKQSVSCCQTLALVVLSHHKLLCCFLFFLKIFLVWALCLMLFQINAWSAVCQACSSARHNVFLGTVLGQLGVFTSQWACKEPQFIWCLLDVTTVAFVASLLLWQEPPLAFGAPANTKGKRTIGFLFSWTGGVKSLVSDCSLLVLIKNRSRMMLMLPSSLTPQPNALHGFSHPLDEAANPALRHDVKKWEPMWSEGTLHCPHQ